MKQRVKVGLLAVVLLGGVMVLPVQEAEAATRTCREVIRHGMVVKRTCTTDYRGHYGRRDYRDWEYRTVCNSYWRHGVKYRTCRRVYY